MSDAKQAVEGSMDVTDAQCQYCGRTFKSPRGRSIHERACKEKASHVSGGKSEEVSDEITSPQPDYSEGGLKVDFRMPDVGHVSGATIEIKQLIAQMEKERKKWEEERKKFMEQTEGLVDEEESYPDERIPRLSSDLKPDVEDLALAEMKTAKELTDIKNRLKRKVDLETMKELLEWSDDVGSQLSDLDENVATLTSVLGEFSARTLDDLESLRKKLNIKADGGELKTIKKTIRKMNEKLEDIVEEVGFGEHLDLSKVPPRILELTYETTLNDIAGELNKVLGPTDAERAVEKVMEEIRLKTSGSELFRYESPRFNTGGLASSIENGLVSAKQVQMTYDELLKKLKDHLPQYHPKNFRGMIKVKSQEFAVESGKELAKVVGRIQQEIQSLRESISSTSEDLSKEISKISAELNDITEELKRISSSGREISSSETTDEGGSEPALSLEEVIIKARLEEDANEFQEEVPGPLIEEEHAEEPSYDEREEIVLTSISSKGLSFTKIRKQFERSMSEEDLQSVLDSLVQKGLIEKKRRGKGFVYSLVEEAEKEERSVDQDD
jgi:gas vesicle protein